MSATAKSVASGPARQDAAAPRKGEDALSALTTLVRDDLEACNRLIVERMQSDVALIPHTRVATTLGAAREGDELNLEVDVVAKHVERLVGPR